MATSGPAFELLNLSRLCLPSEQETLAMLRDLVEHHGEHTTAGLCGVHVQRLQRVLGKTERFSLSARKHVWLLWGMCCGRLVNPDMRCLLTVGRFTANSGPQHAGKLGKPQVEPPAMRNHRSRSARKAQKERWEKLHADGLDDSARRQLSGWARHTQQQRDVSDRELAEAIANPRGPRKRGVVRDRNLAKRITRARERQESAVLEYRAARRAALAARRASGSV